ncbi:MAG: glutamate--tRNA ligase [Thermodesulfobacteriota bacterium]|nr:MAG: glutamate--tRNA ligase [Candidatus Dadabacteria bacterium]|tara:strand:- start:205 stop:1569 length:1365 start_codon:yes stop_codon:yes gene_type:complete
MSIVTRFAPSPTGSLHLGVVRTAIFNYLFSKKNSGKLILRIEDTDQDRSTKDSLNQIISSLKWLGIDWDEGPFLQSDRLNIYHNYSELLIDKGLAYKCFMTNEEIEDLKVIAKKEKKIYKYPGVWRNRTDHPDDKNFVVRFKTPELSEISFNDSLRGNIKISSNNLDDFIIIKSDGFPTYNFASAVDDAEMGVTNIIRGEDHLSNTPKQVLIFKSLEKKVPNFTHVSMILGKDKSKLSKRNGSQSIEDFKNNGLMPISIINYLARLGWSHGDQEIFTLSEMTSLFELDNLTKSPAIFDEEKLRWVNSQHIKMSNNDELREIIDIEFYSKIDSELAISAAKEKAKDIKSLKELLSFVEKEYIEINEELFTTISNIETRNTIESFLGELKQLETFDVDEIKNLFNNFLAEKNIKMKALALPLRIILTGSKVSPGIFEIFLILGKELSIKRIEKYLK